MLTMLKDDAAAPARGVDDAQREVALRFLAAMERHVQCLDRMQAEVRGVCVLAVATTTATTAWRVWVLYHCIYKVCFCC